MNMKSSTKQFLNKITSATLIGAVTLSLCACNRQSTLSSTSQGNLTKGITAEAITGNEADDAFITSTASFSIELFRQSVLADTNEGANILISPESVLSALAMTANGAGGDTRTNMEAVLCDGMTIEDLNSYMYTYNNKLTGSEDVTFHLANSIWIKDEPNELQVKDDFLQTDKNYYNADAFLAEFDSDTVTDINNWVKTNTDGMIDSLLNEISDGVVLYLINALAFEGTWETPYKEYQINENGTFTNASGMEEIVPMLSSTEGEYLSSDNATGFIKYYEGGDFAFLALLPDEDMTIEDYVDTLTGEYYIEMYENREYRDVIVQIPEFSYEYSTELSQPLSNMGMPDAFQAGADFTNMATTDTGMLYINRVLHKTYIELDRNGTKAAAVTAVEMTNESCALETEEPPQVILDRPFAYAIIDTETGLPVFMGIVNTVAQ